VLKVGWRKRKWGRYRNRRVENGSNLRGCGGLFAPANLALERGSLQGGGPKKKKGPFAPARYTLE